MSNRVGRGHVHIVEGVLGPQGLQGPQGVPGPTGATGPAVWTIPAAWAPTTNYTATAPASVVTNAGSSYVCTSSHTSTGVFDPTKWAVIASVGATGPTGATGSTGSTGVQGAQGIQGIQGVQGIQGIQGIQGRHAGFQYTWSTDIAVTDPTTGKIKINSGSATAATQLLIHETSATNVAIAALLDTWDDSTSAVRGSIVVQDSATPGNYVAYSVTGPVVDNGAWKTVPVVHVDHGGTLVDAIGVTVVFTRTGDLGQAGAAATIAVGTTTTLASGSPATVANSGTSSAAVFNFSIPQGVQGATGPTPALKWTFDPLSIVDSDPGPGRVRFNNATTSAVTLLFIDNVDVNGTTVTAWLDSLDDSTNSTNKGRLHLMQLDDASRFATFIVSGTVVDGTGYRRVPVTHLASTGVLSGQLALAFSAAGNKGGDGVGGDMFGPASSTDGSFALFDGTTGKNLRDGGAKGSLASLNSINDSNWVGTDLSLANGGTGASDAAGARSNLGLIIGTNVQAQDAGLASLAALGTVADRTVYTTGTDAWAETPLTAFGRSLLDDANASQARSTIGLAVGTDVQAFDPDLDAIAALTSAADKIPYATGLSTWAMADFTSFGRSLVDDANAAAARTTLGLGTSAVLNTTAMGALTVTSLTMGGALTGATTGAFSGAVNVSAATLSTSSTTGAFTVAGGVGVASDIYVGGAVYAGPAAVQHSTGAARLVVDFTGGVSLYGINCFVTNAVPTTAIVFGYFPNVTVGSITMTAAATAYNTSSDGRLKEDLQGFDSGALIDALEAWDFRWKASGERTYGVVAQDAAKVVPQACHHDENIDQWSTDYSKFVPLLLAEVKALRARVAELEGK